MVLTPLLSQQVSVKGLAIDLDKNRGCRKQAEITAEGAKVRAFIVPTNEELAIAQETLEALGK